jgi:glycosyltransferase involved in cell wall biosynthesis
MVVLWYPDSSFGTKITMQAAIILPLMDETTSLRKTVEILLAENARDISTILIVVCGKTTAAAMTVAGELVAQHPGLIQIRQQQRPFLGGAVRDAFEWATGTHVVLMASDLETDPSNVKELIAKAREGYDIVTATRWRYRRAFHGYNPVKLVLNWAFQKIFGILYRVSLTDLTFGFRIFKIEWVKNIEWEELRHPLLLETVLKPLRLGARVVEIPCVWHARVEGESHNSFLLNFLYFRIALKTRFRTKEELLRKQLT